LFDLQDYIKIASHSTAPLAVILYQNGNHGAWSEKCTAQIKLGYALSVLEKSTITSDANAYRAFVTPPFPVEKMAAFGTELCNAQLAAMADRKIILNLRDYARLTSQEEQVKAASLVLPGIYTRMTMDESLPLRVESGACEFIDKTASDKARMFAASFRETHSFNKEDVNDRTLRSCIQGHNAPAIIRYEKSASCGDVGETLVKEYAMYKLACLWRIASTDADFPWTVKLSMRQNLVFN
jgi:hypothetical protein